MEGAPDDGASGRGGGGVAGKSGATLDTGDSAAAPHCEDVLQVADAVLHDTVSGHVDAAGVLPPTDATAPQRVPAVIVRGAVIVPPRLALGPTAISQTDADVSASPQSDAIIAAQRRSEHRHLVRGQKGVKATIELETKPQVPATATASASAQAPDLSKRQRQRLKRGASASALDADEPTGGQTGTYAREGTGANGLAKTRPAASAGGGGAAAASGAGVPAAATRRSMLAGMGKSARKLREELPASGMLPSATDGASTAGGEMRIRGPWSSAWAALGYADSGSLQSMHHAHAHVPSYSVTPTPGDVGTAAGGAGRGAGAHVRAPHGGGRTGSDAEGGITLSPPPLPVLPVHSGGVVGMHAAVPSVVGVAPAHSVVMEAARVRAVKEQVEAEALRDTTTKLVLSGERVKDLRLIGTTLQRPMQFEECVFDHLVLRRVTARQTIVFRHCIMLAPAFDDVTWEAGVKFLNCTFRVAVGKRANFERCTSAGPFLMRTCTVDGRLLLVDCEYGDVHDMWETEFRHWVEWRRCRWRRDADLRSCNVGEGLVMRECDIAGDLLLRGSTITKKLSLEEGTVVRGCLDLQKSRLRDYAYLEGSLREAGAAIRLQKCVPHHILIRPAELDGKVMSEREALVPATHRVAQGTSPDARAALLEQARQFGEAAEEFGMLKNNYNRLNWMDEEDWAYYRYKVCKRRAALALSRARTHGRRCRCCSELGLGAEWLFIDQGCGYGTEPFRVFRFSFYVVLLFAILAFFPVIVQGPQEGYDPDNVDHTLRSYKMTGNKWADSVLTALTVSFSVYTSGFDAVDKNVDGWLSIVFAIESFVGLMFFGLFVVSFSRRVIR